MLIVSHFTLFGLVSGNINHNKIGIKRTREREREQWMWTCQRYKHRRNRSRSDFREFLSKFGSSSTTHTLSLYFSPLSTLCRRLYSFSSIQIRFDNTLNVIFLSWNPCLFHFLHIVSRSLHFETTNSGCDLIPSWRRHHRAQQKKIWKNKKLKAFQTSAKMLKPNKIRCVSCWHGLKL